MYTFLCQVEDRVQFDFVLEVLNAVDFVNWYNNSIIYNTIPISKTKGFTSYDRTVIPIGSIEFVESFYRNVFGIEDLRPVNIPLELLKFAKRKIYYGDEKQLITSEMFCKTTDKLKGYTDIIKPQTNLLKGNYMFSELIDIDSEWRCFVLKGELIAIHNYSNSLGLYPDIQEVTRIIEAYTGLDAYTLDIGVNKNEGTFIIEIHDFYSCGLYGFRDYNKLLQMLIASHNQKIKGKVL